MTLAAGTTIAALAAAMIGLLYWVTRLRRQITRLYRQLETTSTDLQRLQQSCAQLAPGDLVDQLITEGAEATAEFKEVTALFVDLVGYTTLSERLEPESLLRILNGYIERMSDAITRHHGHVSTYLGDGILAYFGALEPNPWQSDDAAHAALSMRTALDAYNEELEGEGLPRLAIGIGLHRGTGLAGMIGTPDRLEYAFIGRTVNITARVQDLTRTHEVDILLTESVCAKLNPRFRLQALPETEVKGLSEPIATYALVGLDERSGQRAASRSGK